MGHDQAITQHPSLAALSEQGIGSEIDFERSVGFPAPMRHSGARKLRSPLSVVQARQTSSMWAGTRILPSICLLSINQ